MKQDRLILGNIVKGYKGEKEFVITQINEETVILDNEKEVKISTLLKNYKLVKEIKVKVEVEEEAAKNVEVELPIFQLKLVAPMIAGSLPVAKIEEKIADVIYSIKVVKGINQTLIWKVLKKVCENKGKEGIVVANQLSK